MPSYLDLGLIIIILVSALLSMVRGFTRAIAPVSAERQGNGATSLALSPVSSVAGLVAEIAAAGIAVNKDRNRVTK